MKFVHLITGLGKGGAEKNLLSFTKVFKNQQHLVISLTKESYYSCSFPANVSIIHLDSSICKSLAFFFKLGWLFNKDDEILAWLYHGQFAALLFSCFTLRFNYTNMIRSSLYGFDSFTFLRKLILKLICFGSYLVKANYYNSFTSKDQHEAIGFRKNSVIIPNIKLDEQKIGLNVQNDFNFWKAQYKCIFAFIGRDHHDKGVDIFLNLAGRFPESGFLVVSDLIDESSIDSVKVNKNIYNLPFQKDISSVFEVIDCLILTSRSESLPNIVIDSVLNKTAVIAFDVGDVARLVSPGDFLVKDIDSLDTAVKSFIDLSSKELSMLLEENYKVYSSNNLNKKITDFF